MSVETIVNGVKSRVEPIIESGHNAVTAGVRTLKSANAIVADSAHSLVKTQVDAGKDLIDVAKAGYKDAKAAGVKVVIKSSNASLAQGKERVRLAYKESAAIVAKTGDDLSQTLKEGYGVVASRLSGVKTHKQTADARKAQVKAKKAANRPAA